MVPGQVLSKEVGGGLTLFLFNFFKVFSFLHLEITLPFAKLCYAFFFHHNFYEKRSF